jgi:preprotein translocase subunit SecG
MMNILLFIHIVIAVLLIIVILLQRTGADGLSSIGGGNNMGIVSGRSAANFLTRITIILASMFFVNAIVLANLSTKKTPALVEKIEQLENKSEGTSVPIAK